MKFESRLHGKISIRQYNKMLGNIDFTLLFQLLAKHTGDL